MPSCGKPTPSSAFVRVMAANSPGFLEDIQDGLCDIERVRPVDETRAIDLLRRYVDKKYSFCDALSFIVMEQLGVAEALGFDNDFRSYGKLDLVS
jgi:predicted nucleic acid-binding protein